MNKRKVLILDTSVLLYDKDSIHSFPNNDVVLPLIVLDELDRFKDRPGILGENARYVNRYLDELRVLGRLDKGVTLEDGSDQTIMVTQATPSVNTGGHLDMQAGDNMIIAAALALKEQMADQEVKVITKDINLRVKCDSLELIAEDYYKDYIDIPDEVDSGMIELELLDHEIDELYAEGFLNLGDDDNDDFFENLFVTCKGSSYNKSALGIYRDEVIDLLDKHKSKFSDVKPRNREQSFALHALYDYSIPLVSLTGLAGSGKTFLALMAAIDQVSEGKYERIVVTRNIEPVGKELGYLPGDVNDKMAPWLSPLMDNFRCHFKDNTYFELMIEKGKIEIAPLSFIRGRTFNNSLIIVDEAQNASIHELKTIITRLGDGSKIVLMGDTDQIDTSYLDKKSNGLAIVIEKFKTSNLSAHIHLQRGERSALATYASKIL